MTAGALLGALSCAWALWLMGAALTAVLRRRRRDREQASKETAPDDGAPGRVLLIRPCAGDEPYLSRCLESSRLVADSFDTTVVFAVTCPEDAALPAIGAATQKLLREGISARTVIAPRIGPNRKVCNLEAAAGVDFERYAAVICADSNVDFSGLDVVGLLSALKRQPRPGAIWVPMVELAPRRAPGNRVLEAALHGSWHAFGLLSSVDPAGLVGKLFAVSPRALRAIGGFAVLSDYLGEDMELSRRLRQRGFTVEPFAGAVKTLSGPKSWCEAVARLQRWVMVIKAQRSLLLLSYPVLFFGAPIAGALSVVAASMGARWALCGLALAALSRMTVGWFARRFSGQEAGLARGVADMVLADSALALAFVRAIGTSRVRWRGRSLAIDSSGRLVRRGGSVPRGG